MQQQLCTFFFSLLLLLLFGLHHASHLVWPSVCYECFACAFWMMCNCTTIGTVQDQVQDHSSIRMIEKPYQFMWSRQQETQCSVYTQNTHSTDRYLHSPLIFSILSSHLYLLYMYTACTPPRHRVQHQQPPFFIIQTHRGIHAQQANTHTQVETCTNTLHAPAQTPSMHLQNGPEDEREKNVSMFVKQLRAVQAHYLHKARILHRALCEHVGPALASWQEPTAGMFLWIKLHSIQVSPGVLMYSMVCT